jgi:hypothetical protein
MVLLGPLSITQLSLECQDDKYIEGDGKPANVTSKAGNVRRFSSTGNTSRNCYGTHDKCNRTTSKERRDGSQNSRYEPIDIGG